MRKLISLFLVAVMLWSLAACGKKLPADKQNTNPTAAETTPKPEPLTDEKLVEIARKQLEVPDKAGITFTVTGNHYWEAANTYYKAITFYENDKMVAGASVDPMTGDLLRNIYKYAKGAVDPQLLFQQFLSGEITACSQYGNEKLLKAYLSDEYYTYTIYDVRNDGITELCIRQPFETLFFREQEGRLVYWQTVGNSYETLLNNGAFLYERHGGAPNNTRYKYYELNEIGHVDSSVEFSWWDGENPGQGRTYLFEDKQVSKEEYEAMTEKYLSIGSDKVIWYNKDGTPVITDQQPADSTVQNTIPKSLSQTIEEEIEAAREADSYLPEYTSNAGMSELWGKYRDKWKEIADEYYEKIMQYEDIVQINEHYHSAEDLHSFVANMKINWETYSKVQYEQYFEVLLTVYQSGTIVGPLAASYQYNLQKDWAMEVLHICEMLYIE